MKERHALRAFVLVLIEAGLVLAGVLLLARGYMQIQQPVDLFGGTDWDALQYLAMAEQVRAGEQISAQGPEFRRIGTAMLAGWLTAMSPLEAFYRIEVFCAVVSLMGLHLWARLHCRSPELALFFTLLGAVTLWSPLRSSLFFVTGIESSSFLLIIAGFLVLDRYQRSRHPVWLSLLCLLGLIGGIVREACLLPVVVAPFIGNPIAWDRLLDARLWRSVPWIFTTFLAPGRRLLLLPVLCALAGLQVVSALSSISDQWNYFDALFRGLANIGPLRYVAGLLNALGPLPVILALCHAPVRQYFAGHQTHLVLVLLFLVMSWGAHGDERYFVWVLPVVIAVSSRCFEAVLDRRALRLFLACLAVPTLFSIRAFFPAPLPVFPVIQKPILEEAFGRYLPEAWHYFDLIAYTSEPKTVAVVTVVNLVAGWLLWVLLLRLRRHPGA